MSIFNYTKIINIKDKYIKKKLIFGNLKLQNLIYGNIEYM